MFTERTSPKNIFTTAALLAMLVFMLPAAAAPASNAVEGDPFTLAEEAWLDEAYCSGELVHPIGESIADTFDIAYDEIMHYYCQGSDFEDILLALETASESKVPFSEVILSRQEQQPWEQIWEEQKTLLVGCGNSAEETTAEELAASFEVSYADVMSLYCQGFVFDEIQTALDEVNFSSGSVQKLLSVAQNWKPRKQIWVNTSPVSIKLNKIHSRTSIISFDLANKTDLRSEVSEEFPELVLNVIMVSMVTKGQIGLPPPNTL